MPPDYGYSTRTVQLTWNCTIFTKSAVKDGSVRPAGSEANGGRGGRRARRGGVGGARPDGEDSGLVVSGTGCCFPVLWMCSRFSSRLSWWVETASAPRPLALTFSTCRSWNAAPPCAPFLLSYANLGQCEHVPIYHFGHVLTTIACLCSGRNACRTLKGDGLRCVLEGASHSRLQWLRGLFLGRHPDAPLQLNGEPSVPGLPPVVVVMAPCRGACAHA